MSSSDGIRFAPMKSPAELVDAAVSAYRSLGWPAPRVALVAGSGLGVDLGVPVAPAVPLGAFLPFPLHAVVGHSLVVELSEILPGRHVLYFRGRIHGYQGYTPHQVTLAVRMAAMLGVKVLVLTNAAGGLDPDARPGQLAMITDHLNLTGSNPLTGDLPESWGPRFPDMTGAYDPDVRAILRRCASTLGIELREGVYAGLAGPSYETPAEVRMLQHLGANLVGMSTVHEVIAARHLGVRCAGLSLITNPAAGVTDAPLVHDEVLEAGREAAGKVARLLQAVLADPELL